jgi:hypothetical protein
LRWSRWHAVAGLDDMQAAALPAAAAVMLALMGDFDG